MVTVPVLTVDSGLKGSNLPPSGLSESSGFLSGEFCAPGAATEDADAATNSTAAAHVKNLNRLMIFLLRISRFLLDHPARQTSSLRRRKDSAIGKSMVASELTETA